MSNYNIHNEIHTTIHDGAGPQLGAPHLAWIVVGFIFGGVIFLVTGLDWDFLAPVLAVCILGPIASALAFLMLRKFWKHLLGIVAVCGILGLMGIVAFAVATNLAAISLGIGTALALVAAWVVYAVAAVLVIWVGTIGVGYIMEVLRRRRMKALFQANLLLAQQQVKLLPERSSATPIEFTVRHQEAVCQER